MPTFPHNLREGADVYSSDDHKLGRLHRLVLRRADLSLTHVVIDIGFLRSGHHLWEGGLGLDYDRVVPAAAIAKATDNRVDLNLTATQFKDAPEYTTESFEAPLDLSPGEQDYADTVEMGQSLTGSLPAYVGGTSNIWIVEKLNKSLDEVDIKQGMHVWRAQPHENLGDVERALFDDHSGRLQALVIAKGFFLTRNIVLPIRYISEIIDDLTIHVDITDAELDKLEDYQP